MSTWSAKNIGAVARATSPGAVALSIAYPTPIAAGDILLCGLLDTIAGVGFTFSDTDFGVAGSRSTNAATAIYWKVANGSETGSFTVTPDSSSVGLYAQAASFTGGPAAISGNVAASASTGGSAALGLPYPALTVPSDNCLIVALGGKPAGCSGFNIPGPFTNEIGQAHFSTSESFVWDYVIQTSKANITAGNWTITSGDAAATRSAVIVALLPAQGAVLAGGASASASATASLSTNIQAVGAASAGVAAVGALTNWTTVTLSGTQYTGPGGIHDPNFWLDVDPPVGTTLYYDATHITIFADGEISSNSNNCSAVVQFFDGSAWSVGIVILTPQMVSHATIVGAAAGALSTAIVMAGSALAGIASTGALQTGIMLVGNAAAVANAAAAMTTGILLNAQALGSVTANAALSGGQASLQGSAGVLTQAVAQLSAKIQLAGQVIANSTVAGALSAKVQLDGAAAALSQAMGDITTSIRLAGDASVVSSAAGAALITSQLSGAANTVSSALGSLLTGILVAGQALIDSNAAASLATGITLAGGAEIDIAAAFKPPGIEAQFGFANIVVLSPTGLPVAQSTFIEGSACIALISYFNAQGVAFVPNAVSYQVSDVVSGEVLVNMTPIATPELSNAITIRSSQNSMVSLSRSAEQHQILFQITDGTGEISNESQLFTIVRVTGLN